MMNHLNKFRNKNYYDETTGDCHKAMDKITELYKESEHGTELVKDIERVLNLQTKDDEYTPSPRAKAKTDGLTFTVPDNLDVNIKYVNDVGVDGTGVSGDEWGPVGSPP
jgi:hypothetical protein